MGQAHRRDWHNSAVLFAEPLVGGDILIDGLVQAHSKAKSDATMPTINIVAFDGKIIVPTFQSKKSPDPFAPLRRPPQIDPAKMARLC